MHTATRILEVDPQAPDAAAIETAARALEAGGLVVLPTETVYGLAADPDNPAALRRIFEAKGRADAKPLARLADSAEQVAACGAVFGPAARRLAEAFWPGPLTMVLDTPDGAVGYRVPDHAVARAVLRRFGGPIAATSANRSGEPDARTAGEALAAVGTYAAVCLDGGPAPGAVPSTVIRVRGDAIEVLRTGAIPEERLRKVGA